MKLAIMQPYFFPYIGYFSLMEYADQFIFFDTPQYITKGWVNRNRILDSGGNPIYMTAPVRKMPRETPINKIEIDNSKDWRGKIYGQLTAYKKRAPEYKDTIDIIHEIIDGFEGENLSKLNVRATSMLADAIGIKCKFDVFSEMNIDIGEVNAPDEWALEISKSIGAKIYVNPPGGRDFFNKCKYIKDNIELKFLESNLRPYIQRIGKWVPGLSIIDMMMFCKQDEIKDILNDYTFVE